MRACWSSEPHPNVCAAAIDVLAEVGTRDAVPALKACAERFSDTPFLPFAVSTTIARISEHRRLGPEWHLQKFTDARAVHVTQEDVRRLCEFLYRRTGMSFDDDKRYYIDRRVSRAHCGDRSGSFQSYFAMLRSDAEHEIEHLVNAFTVNETYFYREDHQLRCMTSNLLARNHPAQKAPGARFASGRSRARPARSLIRSRCG